MKKMKIKDKSITDLDDRNSILVYCLEKKETVLNNENLIQDLKKCQTQEGIDRIFEQYHIKELEQRINILRESQDCVIVINSPIENPRVKRENISPQQILEATYRLEKKSLLRDLGYL